MSAVECLRKLRESWPGPWSWDDWQKRVLTQVASKDAAGRRALLVEATMAEWTSASLPQAPEILRGIVKAAGALRPGQLFFATEGTEGGHGYALWWPWQGGATISVRIGLTGSSGTDDPTALRSTFGV